MPKKHKMRNFFWLCLLLPGLIGGCNSNKETVDQVAADDLMIRNFLSTNNLQAQRDPSGIYYRIVTPGAPNTAPAPVDTVRVHYTGSLLSGAIFDTSRPDRPIRFTLERLIVGWQVMLPQMQIGERRVMYLPSDYGYGSRGQGPIPPNAVLIFDVELLGVNKRR